MGKRIVFILAAGLSFLLMISGCAQTGFGNKELQAEDLQLTFQYPAEITVEDKTYPCQISHDITQCTTIVLTGDTALEGFRYEKSPEATTIGYQDLSYDVREIGFPDSNCFCSISDALDFAQSYVNLQRVEDMHFTGSVNGHPFELEADPQGRIQKIILEDAITVVFQIDE